MGFYNLRYGISVPGSNIVLLVVASSDFGAGDGSTLSTCAGCNSSFFGTSGLKHLHTVYVLRLEIIINEKLRIVIKVVSIGRFKMFNTPPLLALFMPTPIRILATMGEDISLPSIHSKVRSQTLIYKLPKFRKRQEAYLNTDPMIQEYLLGKQVIGYYELTISVPSPGTALYDA